MWIIFAQLFFIFVSNIQSEDITVFSLAGIDDGPDKSYLKWTQSLDQKNFDALSLCMRWVDFYNGPPRKKEIEGYGQEPVDSTNISCVNKLSQLNMKNMGNMGNMKKPPPTCEMSIL